MKESKLFQLLSVLDLTEWNESKHFIKNRKSVSPQIKSLFDFLYQRRRNLNSSAFDIDYIRTKHFDDMSRKNVQNLMSKLCKLIEECLILTGVRKDDIEYNFQQFKLYNDRGLFNLANNKADALIEQWENSSDINRVYFEYILKILHHQYFSNNSIKRERNEIIISLNKALLTSYNANNELYKYATKAAISYKVINERDLLSIGQEKNRLYDTYFSIINRLNEKKVFDSHPSFNYLYKELIENDVIDNELRAIMFSHCESYLTKNIRLAKNAEDSLKLLELYEFGVNSKILTYKERISTIKFQNIIQLACFLKQFEWVKAFQANYGKLVTKEHFEENKLMTTIQLNFGILNFAELINVILYNEFKFFPLRVQSRWFLISTYLITYDNIDFFESQLSNFTQFIYYNKRKLSTSIFEGSLNLAKIFRAYISKPDFSLEDEIAKYENIVFKNRLPEFFEERKRYVKENGITVS